MSTSILGLKLGLMLGLGEEGGSVAEWLVCWTHAQNGLGSNRSRDAIELQS